MFTTHAFSLYAAAELHRQFIAHVNPDYAMKTINDVILHGMANKDSNCQSYASHKYVDEAHSKVINTFMGCNDGNGVFGLWYFKDGSILFALCYDRYVIFDGDDVFSDVGNFPKVRKYSLRHGMLEND